MRIAFYAPLKGPDHPVPSGDRRMARMLVAALERLGHKVEQPCRLRSFQPAPEPEAMARVEAEAAAEVDRLARLWALDGAPDLLFTYHPFYKSPDFVAPVLARTFGRPYVTAEASHAGKRAAGPWVSWHAASEASLAAGAVHFCFTPQDREGLERIVPAARLIDLPPFLDSLAPPPGPRPAGRPGPVRIVTVAMMRDGDKLRSYAFLAAALAALPPGLDWHLTLVGSGPAEEAVRQHFAALPARRLTWRGTLPPEAVAEELVAADLFAWPGFAEAYGLAYLEAAAAGLPALAFACGGIPSVIRSGETGLLVAEGDCAAYAGALARLLVDSELRSRLGTAARRFVTAERGPAPAEAILQRGLARACAAVPAAA